MPDRVEFECNGRAVDVDVADGESLLSVLRERLELVSVKDGCAPQGQCGCCTVLVDGEPRVSCVTPVVRVAGRAVTTIEGLDPAVRDGLAAAFATTGGSQCGFCTPGIVLRAAALGSKRKTARVDLDRALAAHLCRCTGWRTVYDAIDRALGGDPPPFDETRDLEAAAARAALEGGTGQVVDREIPLGGAPFADDLAPRDALVAVPRPPASDAESIEAAGVRWVVDASLLEARAACGQGAGAAHDVRRASTVVASRASGGRGTPRHLVGGARIPGARRVVVRAGCGAGLAARERWRVRREAPFARPRSGGRAGDRPRAHRCASCTPGRMSFAWVRSGRRSRPLRCGATAPSTSTAWSRAADSTRSLANWPTPYACAVRTRWTEAEISRARRSARSCVPLDWPSTRCSIEARARRPPASIADCCCMMTEIARLRSTRASSRPVAASRARASTSTMPPARSAASRSASRPVIRSTRSCCGPTRSVPRTWHSAGCAPRESPSTRPPARCTT